jgi:hypothetical protein
MRVLRFAQDDKQKQGQQQRQKQEQQQKQRLDGADERDGRHVLNLLMFSEGEALLAVPGWFSEFVCVFKGDVAKVRGRTGGDVLKDRGHPFDSELLTAALRFEDSFRDEEHAGVGLEGLDGGLEGEMGEEAEWHGDVAEDAGAVAVAKDGGRPAGVDVGENAEREIETAEKCRGEAGGACGVVDDLVDLVREGAEGIHHIDDFGGEELRDAEAEDVLGCSGDGVGLGAIAGYVGEKEDDVRAGGDGVEEISARMGGVVARVKIETLERRQSGGQRSTGGLGWVLHGWWRLYFVGHARAGDFTANFNNAGLNHAVSTPDGDVERLRDVL